LKVIKVIDFIAKGFQNMDGNLIKMKKASLIFKSGGFFEEVSKVS